MSKCLPLLLSVQVCAGGVERSVALDSRSFAPEDYPPTIFSVTQANFPHDDVTVRVIQARKRTPGGTTPYACRAWLETRKGDRLLQRIYYDDIDAAGFSFGIFVPKHQPLRGDFIAIKEGDYDGRLLLVAKDGSVANLPGGFYFETPDRRFLIGLYATDGVSAVVVDIAQRQVIIDGDKLPEHPVVYTWYRDEGGYFFTDTEISDPPREKQGFVYRLDLEHHTVAKTAITPTKLSAARKVKYDFDPRKKQDCTSTAQ